MHTDRLTPTVADNVRRAMKAKGETLLGMERATGITRSKLRRRLAGNSPWTTNEIAAIASHFGILEADLVTACHETEAAA